MPTCSKISLKRFDHRRGAATPPPFKPQAPSLRLEGCESTPTTHQGHKERKREKMKVTYESYFEDIYTVSELKQAKAVIKAAKEDTCTAADYAGAAMREYFRTTGEAYSFEILKAEATTHKNNGIAYDGFCDGSGFMDVQIEAIAHIPYIGFALISAMLSDIWNIDGEQNIGGLFYVERFDRRQS